MLTTILLFLYAAYMVQLELVVLYKILSLHRECSFNKKNNNCSSYYDLDGWCCCYLE